jgi:hypothetical protein
LCARTAEVNREGRALASDRRRKGAPHVAGAKRIADARTTPSRLRAGRVRTAARLGYAHAAPPCSGRHVEVGAAQPRRSQVGCRTAHRHRAVSGSGSFRNCRPRPLPSERFGKRRHELRVRVFRACMASTVKFLNPLRWMIPRMPRPTVRRSTGDRRHQSRGLCRCPAIDEAHDLGGLVGSGSPDQARARTMKGSRTSSSERHNHADVVAVSHCWAPARTDVPCSPGSPPDSQLGRGQAEGKTSARSTRSRTWD